MKPNGIKVGLCGNGQLTFRAIQPTRAEDAIWDAVEAAINEGWDARRFRLEAAEAWTERLKQDAADANKDLTGA